MRDLETGPNADQVGYWNDVSGQRWVALQERIDAMISPLGLATLERAAPRPGAHCLDVGCGCGQTTLQLAERVVPGGSATGVDVSAPMLEHARRRAAGTDLPVRFERGDAQIHAFEPGALDLVFSRFGVMFFADPGAAFANLRRALAPGGRLVFACWQPLTANAWVTVPLGAAASHLDLQPPADPFAPGPFSLAQPERIREVLGAGGFEHVEIEGHERDIEVGGGSDLGDVVDFVLKIGPTARLLAEADPDTVEKVRAAVHQAVEPHQQDGVLRLGAAIWIVTAA